jgi:phosphatidylserine/phosphatidylglycerophosphate/cardiolipin synthase-like enzyme
MSASSRIAIQVLPSDNGLAVLNTIRNAKKSVHMTMYLLTNDQVIKALIDQKKAGRDVLVVLNASFPQGGNANQEAFDTLIAGGVPVVWGPSAFTFTHAKTLVVDGDKALIMTMNLTRSSASQNREYVVTDSDPADVADVEALFQADYANKATTVTGKLVVSPAAASPLPARTRLKALIESAKSTLDVEGETLSDDVIVDAIILAHQAKVTVRVVIDGANAGTPSQQEAVAKLKAASVPIVAVSDPNIHAKAIVVDGTRAYVGSQNFTANSLLNNREIGVITDATVEVAKVRDAIAKDFAAGH